MLLMGEAVLLDVRGVCRDLKNAVVLVWLVCHQIGRRLGQFTGMC